MYVGEREFDGMTEFVFCSNDVNEEKKYEENVDDYQVVCIKDPNINSIIANKLEFKIVQKQESVFLIHNPFDYENSNGVFMKLYEDEEYPLHLGSVI